uniref:ATP synthase subunit f, mitochondrial n=1 Tax=Nothobranchius furzeri TaxID=105023 RepID=A0A8C6Q8X5_NOTFU
SSSCFCFGAKTPSLLPSGWLWYYRRYVDVKKGGEAGLGMFLAGYCVLSYIWSYPHIKLSHWRKYH